MGIKYKILILQYFLVFLVFKSWGFMRYCSRFERIIVFLQKVLGTTPEKFIFPRKLKLLSLLFWFGAKRLKKIFNSDFGNNLHFFQNITLLIFGFGSISSFIFRSSLEVLWDMAPDLSGLSYFFKGFGDYTAEIYLFLQKSENLLFWSKKV